MPKKKKGQGRPTHAWLEFSASPTLSRFAAEQLLIELHQLPVMPPHFQPSLRLSDFPGDIRDALHVVKTLVEKGPVVARRDFNIRFGPRKINLPLFVPSTGGLWWRETKRPKIPGYQTIFPPALSLWFLLFDPGAYGRLRRCPECTLYFWDPTRNRSKKWCCRRCTHRATSRDSRAAGKERLYRARRRVITKA